MKIINLQQSSDEWHEWRSAGICASDISSLVGSNPFKTYNDIFKLKSGHCEPTIINDAMRHGMENEHLVRDYMNKTLDIYLQPFCVEDEEKPYFKASLDGFDIENKILCEMKCPSSVRILNLIMDHGVVPPYWYDQIQWQMMICEPVLSYLTVRDRRTQEFRLLLIKRNDERIEAMRKVAEKFWRSLQPSPQTFMPFSETHNTLLC